MKKSAPKFKSARTNKIFLDARMNLNLTQADVAKFAGYKSSQVVSNWERGEGPVPLKNMKKLCKGLKLSTKTVHESLMSDFDQMVSPHLK